MTPREVARKGCADVGERLSREVAHFQEENRATAEKMEGERDGRHKEIASVKGGLGRIV